MQGLPMSKSGAQSVLNENAVGSESERRDAANNATSTKCRLDPMTTDQKQPPQHTAKMNTTTKTTKTTKTTAKTKTTTTAAAASQQE